jgi:hypothetical protein
MLHILRTPSSPIVAYSSTKGLISIPCNWNWSEKNGKKGVNERNRNRQRKWNWNLLSNLGRDKLADYNMHTNAYSRISCILTHRFIHIHIHSYIHTHQYITTPRWNKCSINNILMALSCIPLQYKLQHRLQHIFQLQVVHLFCTVSFQQQHGGVRGEGNLVHVTASSSYVRTCIRILLS